MQEVGGPGGAEGRASARPFGSSNAVCGVFLMWGAVAVPALLPPAAATAEAAASPAGVLPAPPEAARLPHADTLHGEVRVDEYFWLRQKENPAVRAYLEAENAYAESVLAPTLPLREKLYEEMVARLKETDVEVPYRKDGWLYYTRTEKGSQYAIHCRKHGSLEAEEQVVLDLNDLARGRSYFDLGSYTVSDNGRLLAFSTDTSGFRQYGLQVKDLTTGEMSPVLAERTGSVAWAADNATLFYTVEDDAKRQYRLYRHRLGTPEHELIFEERDESFSTAVFRGRSRLFLYLVLESLTTSEWRVLAADRPEEGWRTIEERREGIEYSVDDDRERFHILVNDTGRNFRLVTAPLDRPGKANWTEAIPARPDVMLEGVELFARYSVRYERAQGLPRLIVGDRQSGTEWPILLPEPTYAIFPSRNAEFSAPGYRYEYTSLVTPRSTFEYSFEGRASTLLKQQEVLGGFRTSDYRSERIEARAPDGTAVPISLVYRAGIPLDGSAPCLLEGYGAYGIASDPYFSSTRLSLLDRGVIFALAHVRGGGELGKPWHDAGRMLQKENSFTDFIACAEHLIAQKYTSADRLAAEGGSAGGLLVAAVLEVPFVDVINTMSDPGLPLTVGEFEEWGNPAIEEQYRYLRRYSPYENLASRAYPAMLVRTSLNDSQVMYWEPAKYVARLRTLKTNGTPLLFYTNLEAGHSGASGRYDFLKEMAFAYAFVLDQFGRRS